MKSFTIQENINLKHFNTFGIAAKSRYFATINNIEQFKLLLSQKNFLMMQKLILGDGSNILFTKDYDGIIIKNNIKGIHHISEDAHHIIIKVGAGENWHDFVMYCVQHNYAGIENLSLIPGTVGAAPIQNIGAYGVELRDIFLELEALNLNDGSIRTFNNDECQFGYRDSIFKNAYKNHYAILTVSLKLNKQPTFHIDYGNIQETLLSMQIKELSIKSISDAVIQIRQSKLPDPKQLGNAGSFFKNPLISEDHFLKLKKLFPHIPHFATEDAHSVKIPAGWLIEQCGWKGKRFGDIGIYEKQALILVNYGDGRGDAIHELAQKIQHSVKNEFGIELTTEVNLI